MEQSYAAKGTVLDNLNRLDKSASGRVDRISAELQNTVKAAGRQVLWLSVLVALLTLLTVIWIIRRHINQPIRQVIQLIDDIRAGRSLFDGEFQVAIGSDRSGLVTAIPLGHGMLAALTKVPGDLNPGPDQSFARFLHDRGTRPIDDATPLRSAFAHT